MNPRVKEAVLWGVIGLLSFLVLLQGYELLQNVRVELTVKAGMALVVFVATTVITYLASGRVSPRDDGTEATATQSTGGENAENGSGRNDGAERGEHVERGDETARDDETR